MQLSNILRNLNVTRFYKCRTYIPHNRNVGYSGKSQYKEHQTKQRATEMKKKGISVSSPGITLHNYLHRARVYTCTLMRLELELIHY